MALDRTYITGHPILHLGRLSQVMNMVALFFLVALSW